MVTVVGLILLVLYFLQYLLKIEWFWLSELQQQEAYKRWSGLGMALFITFQWVLTFSRVVKRFRKYAMKITELHKWAGALSPLFFYIHSMGMGYGYLLLLAYLFFSNMLIGQINLDVIKNSNETLFKGWMILHVALSVMITFIMFFHIGVVFYYK